MMKILFILNKKKSSLLKMKVTKVLLVIAILLIKVHASSEFNAGSPMPKRVMSRFANESKPRLVIPHVTEFANYFNVVIPLGLQMAIEGLSKVTPHLKDFEFEVELIESYCKDQPFIDESMALLELETRPDILPIHLAGGCPATGQRLVGELAHHYNFTAIAFLDVVTESFNNRNRFQNFFTLSESLHSIHEALLTFMQRQGWSRVALLSEDHTFYNKVCDPFFGGVSF